MQVKKEDLRNDIIEAAKNEILDKGYDRASMRVIARIAHTTLGNVYNYFSNKEELLGAVLEPLFDSLDQLVKIHFEEEQSVYSLNELEDAFNQMDDFYRESEFKYLMNERIIILFELKNTKYLEKRNYYILKFKEHMAWHLGIDDLDSPYITVILNMFIDCIKHVLAKHDDIELQKEEFIKVFKMLCAGIVINEEK